ncbi:MAG TPA: universal stress protein [Terriglobales bacterium]|nr:universal stress protein [Terriglobales bacterium]
MTTAPKKDSGGIKILIPVGELVSRKLIAQALHVLSAFRNPMVLLFHVIEIPSRTAALETEPYRQEIDEAQKRLNELAEWLRSQSISTQVKVVVARNVPEGITDEADIGEYSIIFLMKRQFRKDWRRLFRRSVSAQVVRDSKCMVLTAPLDDRPTAEEIQ